MKSRDIEIDRSETVAVAMSGGVDSSVVAALLVERGHTVIGVTAVMTHEYSRCCADEDIERAKQLASDLGFQHYLVDVRTEFKREITDYFMNEYLKGRTPSPCVVCNPVIKFGSLVRSALRLGASRLATGHYVSLEADRQGLLRMFRGRDAGKDQSYFLARLSQAQLVRTLFPLGDWTKAEVRSFAEERSLACRASRESQDICFVTEGTHGEWIDLRSFDTVGPGDIVDGDGHVLGRHLGLHHYTVGQRKGLGIATGRPMYVVALDAKDNRVIVGGRDEAMTGSIDADNVNWVAGPPGQDTVHAMAQVRYKHEPAACCLTAVGRDRWHCEFDQPQFGVAPGQLLALYNGREVLGGGWICS